MKKVLVLLLFGAMTSTAQDSHQTEAALTWKHVSATYRNLDEIKPTVVNEGKRSIYLSRIWPDGSAQLQRFNEESGKWEFGHWGIRCGTVAQPGVPIEIQSRAERDIHVHWQASTDDWDNPKHFVVQGSTEQRSLQGKYRLILRYSLQPWTLFQHPDAIYTALSSEFVVIDGPTTRPD